jgi:hypothetical protein
MLIIKNYVRELVKNVKVKVYINLKGVSQLDKAGTESEVLMSRGKGQKQNLLIGTNRLNFIFLT